MPLILAIEPDRRQASQLTAMVRGRLHAELVLAESAERALTALGDRVPDLVLTSALLSPKDETALGDRLRSLDGKASYVQTLTIPVLATHSSRGGGRASGVLSALRREKSKAAAPEGCDPAVFAEQCKEYLERAATERAALLEQAATITIKEPVRPLSPSPVTGAEWVVVRDEEPVAQAAEMTSAEAAPPLDEPASAAEPVEDPVAAPIDPMQSYVRPNRAPIYQPPSYVPVAQGQFIAEEKDHADGDVAQGCSPALPESIARAESNLVAPADPSAVEGPEKSSSRADRVLREFLDLTSNENDGPASLLAAVAALEAEEQSFAAPASDSPELDDSPAIADARRATEDPRRAIYGAPRASDDPRRAAVSDPTTDHSRRPAVSDPTTDHSRRPAVSGPTTDHSRRAAVSGPTTDHSRRAAVSGPTTDHPRRAAVSGPTTDHPRRAAVSGPTTENPRRAALSGPTTDNSRRAALSGPPTSSDPPADEPEYLDLSSLLQPAGATQHGKPSSFSDDAASVDVYELDATALTAPFDAAADPSQSADAGQLATLSDLEHIFKNTPEFAPAAAPAPKPAAAKELPDLKEWEDIVEALRRDAEQLEARQPAVRNDDVANAALDDEALALPTVFAEPAAPVAAPATQDPEPPGLDAPPVEPESSEPADAASADPAAPKKRRKRSKASPAQDEWGFFDPDQCGFAALIEKLEEINDKDDTPAPRGA